MEKHNLNIERMARDIRNQFKIESYGIRDIFGLVEKMDIYLIRMPLGRDTVCGFSTVYEGKKVIVSNSSEILSREIFTVAHEIGHCVFDLDFEEQKLIVDKDIDSAPSNYMEKRADIFAGALLLPEEEIRDYVKYELEKSSSEIIAIDIVRMQIEFGASFAAIVMKLFKSNMIDAARKNQLFEERDSTTSRKLFRAMNLSNDLISSTDVMKVPNRYYEYVFSNYENGYVAYEKMVEALKLVGFEIDDMDQPEIKNEKKEIDLEDLLEGF